MQAPPPGAAEKIVHDYALAIVDTLRESLLVLDEDHRVVSANRCFYETFRAVPEETVGQVLYELKGRHWDIPALRRLLEEVLPHQTSFDGFEVDHRFPSLGRRVMLLNARRLRTPDGARPLILLVISDVTVQKETAERLAAYAQQLERSNRELQEFAQVASHDLQEPLRKIQAFADLLRKEYGDALPPEARGYVASMQSAAARMRGLVNALLALARVTTRGRPFVPVALGELVREVLADLETAVAETGAAVEVGELPTVPGDPAQLRQVFQNLIGNALKFRREGVVPRVRIAAEPRSDGAPAPAVLTVADNGIGFDEKYLDRIFLPFERLHTRQSYAGTGMGLAITRKIVERHGGTITARSKSGAGTTFVVTLPLHSPPEGAPHDQASE